MNANTADKAREKPALRLAGCFVLRSVSAFCVIFSVGAYDIQKNRNPSPEAIL